MTRVLLGRADLLKAWSLARADAAQRAVLAQAAGFLGGDVSEVAPGPVIIQPDPIKPIIDPGPPPPAAKRPVLSARFPMVTQCERLPDAPESPTIPTAAAAFGAQDCEPRKPGQPVPWQALVTRERLWPAVKASISETRPGRLDADACVARLGRGRPLHRLPRQQRRVIPASLLVLWDQAEHLTPYQRDFAQLVELVAAELGGKLMEIRWIDGHPERCRDAARGPGLKHLKACDPAPPGAPIGAYEHVLILSDMGALRFGAHETQAWLTWVTGRRQQGLSLFAWVPHSATLVQDALVRHVRTHTLTPLRPAQPITHGHPGLGLPAGGRPALQVARDRLLTLGAFCIRQEPELLRRLRGLETALAAEPGLEALAWTHRPVVGSSWLSRPLSVAHQTPFRLAFAALPAPLQAQALEAALAVHAVQGRSTEVTELLVWASHARAEAPSPVQAELIRCAREWMERWLATQSAGTSSVGHAADFARDLLARNAADTDFQARQSAWLARAWSVSGIAEIPPGLDAGDVRCAMHARPEGRAWPCKLDFHGNTLFLRPVVPDANDACLPDCHIQGVVQGVDVRHEATGTRRWRPLRGTPVALTTDDSLDFPVTLSLGSDRYRIELGNRPAWATHWGADEHGLYAILRLGNVRQVFCYIPPTTFLMGSPKGVGRTGHETRHFVTITQGYWLADTPCTQALWMEVLGGKNPSKSTDGPYSMDHPVENVSWYDVQRFLSRLNSLLPPECTAAMPTEAEWELACRAGTTSIFPWGDDFDPTKVNVRGKGTTPVKLFPPNKWGVYDMMGNVSEWCADVMRQYGESGVVDPKRTFEPGLKLAVRGGSWRYAEPYQLHSGSRGFDSPEWRNPTRGFRFVLRTAEPSKISAGRLSLSTVARRTPPAQPVGSRQSSVSISDENA